MENSHGTLSLSFISEPLFMEYSFETQEHSLVKFPPVNFSKKPKECVSKLRQNEYFRDMFRNLAAHIWPCLGYS